MRIPLTRPLFAVVMATLSGGASAAAAPVSAAAIAHRLLQPYVDAWDRADAEAMAAAFAPDGDFMNPSGAYARGHAEIAAFYRSAFARGYAGSHATFELRRARRLTPGVIAVDGDWTISGAHEPDSSSRPPEAGSATAILVRSHGAWRVAVLREQALLP